MRQAASTRIAEIGCSFGLHSSWLLDARKTLEHTRTLRAGGDLWTAEELAEMEKRDKAHVRWCQQLVLSAAREIAAILAESAAPAGGET